MFAKLSRRQKRTRPISLIFKAAFLDTVCRTSLWRDAKSNRCWTPELSISRSIHVWHHTQCAVMIDGKLTKWFQVLVGVRPLTSSTYFWNSLWMNWEVWLISTYTLKCQRMWDTPDDTTLISLIFAKLKPFTRELENACNKWGMKINV